MLKSQLTWALLLVYESLFSTCFVLVCAAEVCCIINFSAPYAVTKPIKSAVLKSHLNWTLKFLFCAYKDVFNRFFVTHTVTLYS